MPWMYDRYQLSIIFVINLVVQEELELLESTNQCAQNEQNVLVVEKELIQLEELKRKHRYKPQLISSLNHIISQITIQSKPKQQCSLQFIQTEVPQTTRMCHFDLFSSLSSENCSALPSKICMLDNFHVVPMPADGSCFYHSICYYFGWTQSI
jgi:hypothetical protein